MFNALSRPRSFVHCHVLCKINLIYFFLFKAVLNLIYLLFSRSNNLYIRILLKPDLYLIFYVNFSRACMNSDPGFKRMKDY